LRNAPSFDPDADSASIVSEKLANEYKTAAQKFDEACTSDFVLVSTLLLFAGEVAFCSKRRININKPDAGRPVSAT